MLGFGPISGFTISGIRRKWTPPVPPQPKFITPTLDFSVFLTAPREVRQYPIPPIPIPSYYPIEYQHPTQPKPNPIPDTVPGPPMFFASEQNWLASDLGWFYYWSSPSAPISLQVQPHLPLQQIQFGEEQNWVWWTTPLQSLTPSAWEPEEQGVYRVENDIAGYTVYVGIDVQPDLDGTPTDYFTVFPYSYAALPPVSGTRTYNFVVRTRDTYGLQSVGQTRTSVTVDSAGSLVLLEIGAPERSGAFQKGIGSVQVLADYAGHEIDQYPADQWNVWVGTILPTPGVTIPNYTAPTTTALLAVLLTGLAPGTYYVSTALHRIADGGWSPLVYTTVMVVDAPLEIRSVPGSAAR